MKYAEINNLFTQTVAEYLGKGYTINTASMGGSQGEVAKVDLTNGKEIVRVMLNTFFNHGDLWLEGIELAVGRCTDSTVPNSSNDYNTFWSSNSEIIYSEKFFEIGSKHSCEKFYGTEEEATNAKEIYFQRARARGYRSSTPEVDITDKALEIAKRVATTRLGVRRIRRCDLRIVNQGGKYTVYYGQKRYRLH